MTAKIRLSDLSAKNDDNDDTGMVISGTLQLDSSISKGMESKKSCLRLHVEVQEKERVRRAFGTDFEKVVFILLNGRFSYSKEHENILLQKEYLVGEDQRIHKGEQEICFSVHLGKESQSWKPRRSGKVKHRQGHYRREGIFEVVYMVKASITKASDGGVSTACHWSNEVDLQFTSTVGDKRPHHDLLRVSVGTPVMIPQKNFFGFVKDPQKLFFALIPTENKIQLRPNQQLTIQLYQNPSNEDALIVDLDRVHVKFTQRNVFNRESFDRHWEKTLEPSTVNTEPHTLQGTVSVPGFLTPSYHGSIIQVVNEMTIYITQDENQAKETIAASPKIIVQLNA